MAAELADLVEANNARGADTRAIVPCGPSSWYAPWTETVNARRLSLRRLTVFHMDECLDWQGRAPAPRPSLQLPDLHGAPLLRRDPRGAERPRGPALLAAARRHRARARRDRVRPRGPHARRVGAGRSRRLQPGAPLPVPRDEPGGSPHAPRSACRTTTRTRSSPSPSARSAPPTSSSPRSRSRSECASASPPDGCGSSATPAPGSRRPCASPSSPRRRPSTRSRSCRDIRTRCSPRRWRPPAIPIAEHPEWELL